MVAGVSLLLLGPGIAATLTGSLIASVGGNYVVTAAQPALSVHHGVAGPPAVTEGNGFGSGIGLLAPLAVGGSVALGWGWRPAVALAIAFMAVSAVLLATLRKEPALAPPARTASPAPRRRNRYSAALWFFLVAMICGIAIEMSTSMWAPDLLVSRAGAPASLATAAVAAMVLGMTAARFVVGPIAARKAPEKLLLLSFTIALAGWLVLWLATTPAMAMAGLLVAGFGYGAHYPLGMSLVLRSSAGRPDQAQGLSMLGAGLAVGVVPFALGSLADAYGTHRAFLVIGVLIAVGGTAVALGLRAVHRALRESVHAAHEAAGADGSAPGAAAPG
jgi:predicted MFS family arabinose efflux permease